MGRPWTAVADRAAGRRRDAIHHRVHVRPGPQIPLYLVKSRLLEIPPHIPLMGTLGIGMALFRDDGVLSSDIFADFDLVPDLHQLESAIEDAFAELRSALP